MKEHFEHQFYDKNHQTIDTFERPLNLPISRNCHKEIEQQWDETAAELVIYAPVELWKVIKFVLSQCFELVPIQKPGKPRGPLKNLHPVILLQIIRKILSNIATRRMKDRYEDYISPSQSAYRRSHSTADIVWTQMGKSKNLKGRYRSSFNWNRHVISVQQHQQRAPSQHHQVHFWWGCVSNDQIPTNQHDSRGQVSRCNSKFHHK